MDRFMNKLKFIALLGLFVVSITAAMAQDTGDKVAITLERTACFGTCPVYMVSILEDGTVIYQGENFVDMTGEQRGQIDPATVEQMVAAFEAAGYFDWNEAYDTMNVTDLPYVTTSVTRNGETKQILRYAGDDSAPLALPFLENWVDLMAGTPAWTGAPVDSTVGSVGMNNPVITLQRDPCFGMCPVYGVVIFEDGTTVFTGVANVNKIGVEVFQQEASMVDSIVGRAESSGYFGWQDSYDFMTITDQARVTTSIQTPDHYKRIMRYAGDANAPVGLLWVEESIETLVGDLVG
ncbi:MAG: DUF6438 domain-containing protein [Anaerolineae bacterium]|nr:DUF6438 domain-containing protein [Anaerolineae bacterium]